MAFQLESKPLAVGVAFKTSDGTQYPANWLRLATADEKKKIGITEVADEAKAYDQRFYISASKAKELDDSNAKDADGNIFIQSAGGKFTNNNPDHFGSGLCLETQGRFKEDLEIDTGQYDHVREVAWTTFGGIYIRREVFNKLGNFSPEYEWTYNRDVDYCLRAREAGFKIYQIPVRLIHFESRDNKKIKANDQNKVKAEMRNLQTLKEKWENTEFYKTLDEKVND